MDIEFVLVNGDNQEQLEQVVELFEEYRKSLPIDLCFQNYQQELADLPGKYLIPKGRLYLAYVEGEVAGCVALRPFDNMNGEVKRLYVRKQYRKCGVGRYLMNVIIDDARQIGYDTLLLDTLSSMKAAIRLYENLGFEICPSYYNNPNQDTVYMQMIISK